MENTTTPVNEETVHQQQKVEELNKYNRDYYRAHKKPSTCKQCKIHG